MMNIINEEVILFLDDLYKPLSAPLGDLRRRAEERKIPIILKDTEGLLFQLLRIKNPAHLVEIGTAVGYSACCFGHICPEARIKTIEYQEKMAVEARKNIKALGMEHQIQVIQGDAREVLRTWQDDKKIDFAFIDGGKSHYEDFFNGLLPLCNPGAMIVSDNIFMSGKTISDQYDPRGRARTNIRKMREYITMLNGREDASTAFLPMGDGLAVTIIGE
jgi:predicted O-methyltransferase YrrM